MELYAVFRGAFRRHGWGEGWGANGIRGTEGAEAETLKASREWGFPLPSRLGDLGSVVSSQRGPGTCWHLANDGDLALSHYYK